VEVPHVGERIGDSESAISMAMPALYLALPLSKSQFFFSFVTPLRGYRQECRRKLRHVKLPRAAAPRTALKRPSLSSTSLLPGEEVCPLVLVEATGA